MSAGFDKNQKLQWKRPPLPWSIYLQLPRGGTIGEALKALVPPIPWMPIDSEPCPPLQEQQWLPRFQAFLAPHPDSQQQEHLGNSFHPFTSETEKRTVKAQEMLLKFPEEMQHTFSKNKYVYMKLSKLTRKPSQTWIFRNVRRS